MTASQSASETAQSKGEWPCTAHHALALRRMDGCAPHVSRVSRTSGVLSSGGAAAFVSARFGVQGVCKPLVRLLKAQRAIRDLEIQRVGTAVTARRVNML